MFHPTLTDIEIASVSFDKTFTSGNLKGITVGTSITTTTARAREIFEHRIANPKGKDAATGSTWVASNVRFED